MAMFVSQLTTIRKSSALKNNIILDCPDWLEKTDLFTKPSDWAKEIAYVSSDLIGWQFTYNSSIYTF
jgi:hypothetical protein